MREWQARKDTRAVIVSLAAVWSKNVIVGTMLVVVLEKVFYLRLPFDQLAPFELVELLTDPGRVFRMRGQQEQKIVKEEVSRDNSTADQQNYPHNRKTWRYQASASPAGLPCEYVYCTDFGMS